MFVRVEAILVVYESTNFDPLSCNIRLDNGEMFTVWLPINDLIAKLNQ